MKHRNIDYGIDQAEPGKWRWIIYPKIEVHPKVIGEERYATYGEAEAACIQEINKGLDGKNTVRM